MQPQDAIDSLASGHVNYFDAVVAERGDKKPATRRVEEHVIDPPLHIRQPNYFFEAQRWIRLRTHNCGPDEQERRHQFCRARAPTGFHLAIVIFPILC